MIAPCKDCTERKVGCHADCDKYKEYRRALDAINQKRREDSWAGFMFAPKDKSPKMFRGKDGKNWKK